MNFKFHGLQNRPGSVAVEIDVVSYTHSTEGYFPQIKSYFSLEGNTVHSHLEDKYCINRVRLV